MHSIPGAVISTGMRFWTDPLIGNPLWISPPYHRETRQASLEGTFGKGLAALLGTDSDLR
jgi:hypothetical protein